MKKLSFLMQFLVSVSVVLCGQNAPIELTFAATYLGEPIPLESIYIQNLTQGRDTILYAPSTSLLLEITAGFEESSIAINKTFQISQNIPNPFAGQTAFTVFVPEKGRTEIAVRNTLGKNLAYYAGLLEAGTHRFDFFAGRDQFYLLTVSFNGETRSLKMISNGRSDAGTCRLQHTGSEPAEPMFKSGNNSGGLIFCWGDLLRFTGYASTPAINGSNVIEDSPSGNQSYTFNFTEGVHCPGMPTITDIDGNVYNTVLIGAQCWMKENLRATSYSDGTAIYNVTGDGEWSSLTSGAYVWYGNNILWKDKYGALYNWYAVDANSLCPSGWYVPTHNEWKALTDYIGGTGSPNGNELKSCREVNSPLGGDCNTISHPRWEQDTTHYGSDDYGFSGLPGGSRNYTGAFSFIGFLGRWWTSTEQSSTNAWIRYLSYSNGSVGVYYYDKHYGLSVRCIRDN
jgi:uncharacterized protein (TIGR02145 family)